MRRLLSILLLAVLGMPLVASVFAAGQDPEAGLAACCRRNGKHHCSMGQQASEALPGQSASFQAPAARCPYCPRLAAVYHPLPLAGPPAQSIFAALVSHPAGFAQTQSRLRISRDRSRQKRGPPSLS